MGYDAINLKILALLAEDANQRRIMIAKQLGITESSLSKRIAGLEADGTIKRFTVELDLAKLGYGVNAISLIKLEHQSKEKIEQVTTALQSLTTALEYSSMLGDYDYFVRWCCKDNLHLLKSLDVLFALGEVKVETLTFGDHRKRSLGSFDPFL